MFFQASASRLPACWQSVEGEGWTHAVTNYKQAGWTPGSGSFCPASPLLLAPAAADTPI